MSRVLEVTDLRKAYADQVAVAGISFALKRGEIVGFLGPNGAGKTTTIQMLLGITTATSGTISYFGKDFSQHREQCLQRINTTSAFNTLMGRISVWENLVVFAELYEVKDARAKIISLLKELEAEEITHRLYKDLSSGQKTRVNLVKSLLNDPEILLMDEPTASLDPDIADKTLTLIERLRVERNLSILYTSHNMSEIDRICDRVIFLDHGKVVAEDTPKNLTKLVSGATLRVVFDQRTEALEKYLAEKALDHSFPEHATIEVRASEREIPGILFELSNTGIWIEDIEVVKPTLEDVFLQFARK